MLVTVTLNAAIDRTLTVPNFQRGLRHRASQALTLAGGKGINVARALKVLGVPVVATGLTGGRTGTRVIEELTQESILNDFVRIEGESRTSTAVVESGCKRAIGLRLKEGGMFWTVDGANAIIALRCCLLSGRFESFWERRSSAQSG